jgi:hypothetical protein
VIAAPRYGVGCAVLVVLLLPAAAAAAPRPALSVQDEAAITCNHWGLRASALAAAAELGATVIRFNLTQWSRRSCPGAATAAAAITAAGLRPQLTLTGSVGWIAAQVRRNRRLVSTYAIWNEPDLALWRCCSAPFARSRGPWYVPGDPAVYRAAYLRAYGLVKRLDPGSQVLFGELSPLGMSHGKLTGEGRSGARWVEQVLRPGRPLRADGIAIHPYTWHWSPQVDGAYYRELVAFKRLLRRYARRGMLIRPGGGRRPVPIYNTEYGQSRADGLRGDAANSVQAYRYARRLGFRQHNQYMIFPAFGRDRVPNEWNTAAVDEKCRPGALYFALRGAATGRTDKRSAVAWPRCPTAIGL